MWHALIGIGIRHVLICCRCGFDKPAGSGVFFFFLVFKLNHSGHTFCRFESRMWRRRNRFRSQSP